MCSVVVDRTAHFFTQAFTPIEIPAPCDLRKGLSILQNTLSFASLASLISAIFTAILLSVPFFLISTSILTATLLTSYFLKNHLAQKVEEVVHEILPDVDEPFLLEDEIEEEPPEIIDMEETRVFIKEPQEESIPYNPLPLPGGPHLINPVVAERLHQHVVAELFPDELTSEVKQDLEKDLLTTDPATTTQDDRTRLESKIDYRKQKRDSRNWELV